MNFQDADIGSIRDEVLELVKVNDYFDIINLVTIQNV